MPGNETVELAKAVKKMPNLNLIGLMTIGAPDDSDEPEAFKMLSKERENLVQVLGGSERDLTLFVMTLVLEVIV